MQSQLEKPKECLTGNYLPKLTLYELLTLDPRPDLQDTETWTKLLKKIAHHKDFNSGFHLQALSTLHSLRTVGTILRWDINYGYKLKPIIGFENWESQEHYDSIKHHLIIFTEIFRTWFSFILD